MVDQAPDDPAVVITMKVLLMPRSPVPGAVKLPCGCCGQAVWFCPATAEMLGDRPRTLMCQECFAASSSAESIMPVSEGQLAEVLAAVPSATRSGMRKLFGTPAKRRAALDRMVRENRARKRIDN